MARSLFAKNVGRAAARGRRPTSARGASAPVEEMVVRRSRSVPRSSPAPAEIRPRRVPGAASPGTSRPSRRSIACTRPRRAPRQAPPGAGLAVRMVGDPRGRQHGCPGALTGGRSSPGAQQPTRRSGPPQSAQLQIHAARRIVRGGAERRPVWGRQSQNGRSRRSPSPPARSADTTACHRRSGCKSITRDKHRAVGAALVKPETAGGRRRRIGPATSCRPPAGVRFR